MQNLWDDDAAVFLLIVLQHRDERSPNRKPGAVECVNKNGFTLGLSAVANLRTAGLEVFACIPVARQARAAEAGTL